MKYVFWAGLMLLGNFSVGGAGGPQLPEHHLPAPIVRQSTDYSCGAASLLSALFYWNRWEAGEIDLHEMLQTSKTDGTSPESIVKVARELGLQAWKEERLSFEKLSAAVKEGVLVIVDFQAWKEDDPTPYSESWEHGHYAVVVGLDENFIYLMDPSVGTNYTYLSRRDFLDRWRDYEGTGKEIVRYQRLGIFLKGEKGIGRFPAPLSPTY